MLPQAGSAQTRAIAYWRYLQNLRSGGGWESKHLYNNVLDCTPTLQLQIFIDHADRQLIGRHVEREHAAAIERVEHDLALVKQHLGHGALVHRVGVARRLSG